MPVPVIFQSGYRLIRGEDLNADFAATGGIPTIGNGVNYYVDATNGVDLNNGGLNPNTPLATIGQALTNESAALTRLGLSSVGRNSVVYFNGTIHTQATINWNINDTHLVGLCSPLMRGKRARISPDPATSATGGWNNMLNITGKGCYFANFQVFYGFANTSAALICVTDTGGHNTYDGVEFLGFGDGTVSTGSSNLTGSRAFKFNTNTGETTWNNCVFGVDTEVRNATNYTVEIAGGAPRLTFSNCVFEADLGSSGTSSSHILIGAAGIDRYVDFVKCRFHNFGANAMAQAFNVSSTAGGTVFMDQCTASGTAITALQTTPTTNMQMNMVLSTTGGGLTHTVF